MECAICAWSPSHANYRFVYETKLWRAVLAPNQSLLGRCVIHLKRHSGDLSDLSREELLEWLELVKRHQAALRIAFGVTMFNWSCYMNHAYRQLPPNPHIHWWAVPRYSHEVRINDLIFNDPHFGNPYDHDRWVEVPEVVHREITERIIHAIQYNPPI